MTTVYMLIPKLWAVVTGLSGLANAQTPPGFTPSCSMNLGVSYSGHISIDPASLFQASDVFAVRPAINSPELDIYKRYMVFMIDLDVIEEGDATTILHWYQADLLTNPISGELFNLTGNGASYVGPTPPPGPGHRYVFLLFLQPPNYMFPECFSETLPLTLRARKGFNIEQFMQVAALAYPIAANHFTAVNGNRATSTRVATATSLSSADCPLAVQTSESLHLDLR